MLAAILALIKAFPIIESWVQQLIAAYTSTRLAAMKQEDVDAIRKALHEFDQRKIEEALGANAGKPSGDAGAVIINHPPGMPHP